MMHDETRTLDDADAYGAESAQDHDPLFWQVTAGPQAGGAVVVDLGWAGMMLAETLGVEHLAGVEGFANADSFYRWMQTASGSPLPDWYGVQLRLYECGYPEPTGEAWCYRTWRTAPDPEALSSRAVDVYCLRHTAWAPQGQTRRAKNSARTRSYCEAAHIKTNPGVPVTPEILANIPGDGLKVSGIRSGHERAVVLDWPAADMAAALDQIAKARGEGVRALTLSENGVGVALDSFTAAQLQQLREVDRHYGGDIMLSDALARAGLVTR
ncbi:hypothetical protein [Duganella phyllosphaerae]|uniref:Uncharacterized protein n=1 Tax=Duganella phyllosphaerae TaxID=762836 RepID=A0A1E7X7Q4_9BURK|nr:hypothetical protein [Duganella phyllosphaerae]OFA09041.1 hypothetical protein DUPY_02830 [Duganella phyllosphaerae]